VSLAEQSSQLVDRVVDMSLAADNDSGSLPVLARLGYVPVIGEATYRLTPDFAIRDAFKDGFAPGFDIPEDFEDIIVDDYRAMTYTSYDEAQTALEDFRDESPLDERMRAALVPVLAIFGEEDQIVDVPEATEDLEDVPGIRIETIPGVGHTPQVEAPEKTADLILGFAEGAGPAVPPKARAKEKAKPDYIKRKRDKPKAEKKRERHRKAAGGHKKQGGQQQKENSRK
jgi:pimeloyl-ACP methyl ester carboxylesterase